jgi:DNA-binding NarL/FixJ family response regulator
MTSHHLPDNKVAIVEDNNDIREALRVLLNGSQGFQCTGSFDCAEKIIAALPLPETDIVLMDIHLPDMSGIDCIKKLKPLLPQSQFMMYTVFDDDVHIFDALKAGANGYILKGTSPAGVLEALRELKAGGSPMSREIARKIVMYLQNNKPSPASDILTPRELEILTLLSQGYLYKEIAEALHIALDTVKKHLYRVYEKLHVANKTEAINKVFKNGY